MGTDFEEAKAEAADFMPQREDVEATVGHLLE